MYICVCMCTIIIHIVPLKDLEFEEGWVTCS